VQRSRIILRAMPRLAEHDHPVSGTTDGLLASGRRAASDVESMPVSRRLPIPEGQVLGVFGAENWNPADRHLGRGQIRSAQLITSDHTVSVPTLDGFGRHGVRDAVLLPDGDRLLLTDGDHPTEVSLSDGSTRPWAIDGLGDLHELSLVDDRLLIANTGHDEVIEATPDGRLIMREDLGPYRHRRSRSIDHERPLGGALAPYGPPCGDHFHANQAFVSGQGTRCVLVHHCDGFRPLRHLQGRLIGHGHGGVIDLDRGTIHRLELTAPHSARWTGSHHIVLDSGRGHLAVFDAAWAPLLRVPVGGWGRGLALDARCSTAFVATSAIRHRYRSEAGMAGANQIVAVDLRTWKVVARRPIDCVEQLWSIRMFPIAIGEALLALDISSH
jgi:hypothetical protein